MTTARAFLAAMTVPTSLPTVIRDHPDSTLCATATANGVTSARNDLLDALAALGARPLGTRSSFLQRIPLAEVRIDKSRTQLVSEFGHATPAVLIFGIDYLPLIGIRDQPFPVSASARGQIIYGGTLGGATAIRPSLAARRIVVFEPPLAPDGLAWFEPSQHTALLAPYAAARAILVTALHLMTPRQITSLMEESTELALPRPPALRTPIALISRAAADVLLETETAGGYIYRGSLPGADYRTAALTYGVTRRPVAPDHVNVIAGIEGTDPKLKNEWIVVTSPLCARAMPALPRDTSDPLLLLAERLMAPNSRPGRSVLLLWTPQDDRRALGAQWYVDHPTVPLQRIAGVIGLDVAGPTAASVDQPALTAGLEIGIALGTPVRNGWPPATLDRWTPTVGSRANQSATAAGRQCRTSSMEFRRGGLPVVSVTTRAESPRSSVPGMDPQAASEKADASFESFVALVLDAAGRPRPSSHTTTMMTPPSTIVACEH